MADDDDEYILAGYDDMGYDDEAGALWPTRRAPRGMAPRRPARQPRQPPRGRLPWGNAAPRRDALEAYQPDARGLPLDQILPFTGGTFTAAVTNLLLPGTPQRSMQPRRLVIDLGRVGATATGIVQVTQFNVGADPQFVQTGAVPASMFGATAVGIMLKPAAARPGITVSLGLSLTGALVGADVIIVSAAAVGPAIG